MSRNFNHFKVKNLLSALPAIDTVSIDHPSDPKSLRFTWNEYDPKLVEKLVSEKLFIVDPGILNLHFSDLSSEQKRGVPAIHLLYEEKKESLYKSGLISEKESTISWKDLSEERKISISRESILPSLKGLKKCKAIGCGQFNKSQLKNVIQYIHSHENHIKAVELQKLEDLDYNIALNKIQNMREKGILSTPITIVDHREEPHLHIEAYKATKNGKYGLLVKEDIDYLPISLYSPGDFFNKGQSNLMVEFIENKVIHRIQSHDIITLSLVKEKAHGLIKNVDLESFEIKNAYSEQELAKNLGLGYVRIPITDHSAMEEEDADSMRVYFDSLSPEVYVIHHCRGGKGRTQTGLLTRDMMLNCKEDITFLEFIIRHYLIGGSNLLSPLEGNELKDWKYELAFERAIVVSNFYKYTKESKDGLRLLYKHWINFESK